MPENKKITFEEAKKMPWYKVLAYALTECAGNLVFCTVTTYINYYYTNIFGLAAGATGTIMLVVRIFDAFDAPIWGFIIDHTHTKWGQCRPYWLFVSFPFVTFFVLMFLTPDLDDSGKFWWALITYLLFGICYTGVGTPCTSILPNITNDSKERVRLVSRRNLGGQVGYFITATFTLYIVSFFANDLGWGEPWGWRIAACVMAILGLIMLLIGFAGTKEVYKPEKATSIIDSIKSAKGNWVWFLLVIIFIFYWLGQSSRTTATIYYAQYVLGDKDIAPLFNTLVMLQIIGMLVIPPLSKKFPKCMILMVSMFVAAFGHVLMMFVPADVIPIAVCWSISSVGMGACISMTFAMLADTVDFGEWKTKIRAVGFLSAVGSSFAIKIGSGFGAWAVDMMLESSGYSAEAITQSANALSAINFSFTILPAIFFALGGLLCIRYLKYEKLEPQIQKELAIRRGELKE